MARQLMSALDAMQLRRCSRCRSEFRKVDNYRGACLFHSGDVEDVRVLVKETQSPCPNTGIDTQSACNFCGLGCNSMRHTLVLLKQWKIMKQWSCCQKGEHALGCRQGMHIE